MMFLVKLLPAINIYSLLIAKERKGLSLIAKLIILFLVYIHATKSGNTINDKIMAPQ